MAASWLECTYGPESQSILPNIIDSYLNLQFQDFSSLVLVSILQ